MFDRRTLLVRTAQVIGATTLAPGMVLAKAPVDQRFVFIIMRGAADGLSIVAPLKDPHFEEVRGKFISDYQPSEQLDGFFTLHSSLRHTHTLYSKKEVLFAHAVASPYRERSHFDGQNILETGGEIPYKLKEGWMNRMLGLLGTPKPRALAIASTIPMALSGPNRVSSYAPSTLPQASDDVLHKMLALYQDDAELKALWGEALATRERVRDLGAEVDRGAARTGALTAALLAPNDGFRIAMIETGGWDTHALQQTRMTRNLANLDALLVSLQQGLGGAWSQTVVIVATEFGRTVQINGTSGTDHGTGAVAMVLGGSINGGRVLADWPGLAKSALFQGRDLRPTMRLDALIAGTVSGLYNLDPDQTFMTLYPSSKPVQISTNLVRS